jgi:hypothetical protein
MDNSIQSNLETLHDRIANLESIIHKRYISGLSLGVRGEKLDPESEPSTIRTDPRIIATKELTDIIVGQMILWIEESRKPTRKEFADLGDKIRDFKDLGWVRKEDIVNKVRTDETLKSLASRSPYNAYLKKLIIEDFLKKIDLHFRFHEPSYGGGF